MVDFLIVPGHHEPVNYAVMPSKRSALRNAMASFFNLVDGQTIDNCFYTVWGLAGVINREYASSPGASWGNTARVYLQVSYRASLFIFKFSGEEIFPVNKGAKRNALEA